MGCFPSRNSFCKTLSVEAEVAKFADTGCILFGFSISSPPTGYNRCMACRIGSASLMIVHSISLLPSNVDLMPLRKVQFG